MRIAHISDLHISTFEGASARDFLNKRVLGGLNLLLHRRAYRGEGAARLLEQLRQDVAAQKPDAIWVTGDLTSLSLPQELQKAKDFVASLGAPDKIMIIPGNHDAYTKDSQSFEELFSDYLDGDYPVVRHLGERLSIIGISSAVATAPLLATGSVGAEQLGKLKERLASPALEGRFVVLALHHPPSPHFQPRGHMRRLTDAQELLSLLPKRVQMIVHGHEHRGWRYSLQKDDWRCEVFDAGSGTALSKDPNRCARYNLYTFSDERPALVEARSRRYDPVRGAFYEYGPPELHPLA